MPAISSFFGIDGHSDFIDIAGVVCVFPYSPAPYSFEYAVALEDFKVTSYSIDRYFVYLGKLVYLCHLIYL